MNAQISRAMLSLALALAAACSDEPPARETASPAGWFVEVGDERGIDFRHRNCATPHKHLLEMNGGAVVVLDHDGDGDLDLFFPQSAALPDSRDADEDLRDRLFSQQDDGRFQDVTDEVGCSDGAYTLSAAAPDVEGDGDPDLLLCNFGRNRLLRNDGGVFAEVEDSGLDAERWSSVAAFADLDRDGDLDAYIGNYAVYDLADPPVCGHPDRGPEWQAYCHPDEYEGQVDALYRNEGVGRFVEVSEQAGIGASAGKALGVLGCDWDDDGDVDLLVANDSTPNFLWSNRGPWDFRDDAPLAGFAVNRGGLSEACMGIDAADVDHDGDWDVIVTNLAMQTNTLYRNDEGLFEDKSFESGLGEPSLLWVGFGVRFFDVDHDRREDMFVVNGHVVDNIARFKPAESFAQPSQLYRGLGGGRYELWGPDAGPYFERSFVGRALATWDPDDDGDLDVVVVDNDGAAHLLENRSPTAGEWIGFTLRGGGGNPAAIGARVKVSVGGEELWREVRGGGSYNAWSDLRVHFGLGEHAAIDRVEVRWPTGATTRREGLQAGRYWELVEGE